MRSDLSSTLSDRLFKHYGPLKTFSGKIDIAYAFSIIDTETFGDLKAIKDIRNKFAHSTKIVQFSNPEVRPLIQKLSGWTAEAKQIDLFLDRCKACVDKFKPLVKSEPVAPDSDD
jgi:DNA-binding MltR family transcriptional regulator